MIEKGTAVGCPFEIVKKACHCEADSPCQGEMSRRDKRDREAQRADVAIRNPVQQPPLSKGGGTAQAVTEGFRPPESCPKNGIPQSASLTAPFNKGAKGRGLRIATSGRCPSSQ